MIAAASAWLLLAAASPSPSPTPPTLNGPTENQFNGSGDAYSAGLYAFLIILGLALFTVVIVYFMNRSLKRARQNLGGDVLPRRVADQIPIAPRDKTPPE